MRSIRAGESILRRAEGPAATAHDVASESFEVIDAIAARADARRMAKKPKRLPPLTGIQRQVVDYVLTNVALGGYSDCCGSNDIALTMDRDPKRSNRSSPGANER